MKHIFYIHSYITYFVSIQVIKLHNFKPEQCVFLYGRGFKPKQQSIKVTEHVSPFSHYPTNTFALERKFWKTWEKLRHFDAFVRKITGGDLFHLYTNQTGIDFIRLLKENRSCTGFSILEEGLYSYYTLDQLNSELCPPLGRPSLIYRILHFLNFTGRLPCNKIYLDPTYDTVYGISDEAFPTYPRRTILPFPFEKVTEAQGEKETNILVFDSFMEYGVIKGSVFEKALDKTFDYLKKEGVKEVYIKYHPEQYTSTTYLNNARSLISKYKVDLTIHELEREASLEIIASDKTNPRVVFYTFFSSIGLYAAMCGRTAVSFAKYIADEDAEYKYRLSLTPQIYKELVQLVE